MLDPVAVGRERAAAELPERLILNGNPASYDVAVLTMGGMLAGEQDIGSN